MKLLLERTVSDSPQEEELDVLRRLARGPTGHDERLVPEVADSNNVAQHLMRYRFSLPYCVDKVILDSGTGMGYGANMVAGVAKRVYGVDYDENPIRYARRKYPSTRLRFLVGDVTELPLSSASADVVLSFEVVEHIADHGRLLRETCRVLSRDGVLVISTPNRETAQLFRHKAGFTWDAHVSEVGLDTFRKELQEYFAHVRIWGMRLRGSLLYGILRPLDPWNLRLRLLPKVGITFAREKVFHVPSQGVSCDDVVISRRQLRQANHFLAVCSRSIPK